MTSVLSQSAGSVLLVDDDRVIRNTLERVLTTMSFQVSGVGNGEEAVAMVRSFKFDAVVLDISMPGMSGVRACQIIRTIKPTLGILMLTVHQAEANLIQALDAGADDYMVKPFHVGELAARLRALIRRSRRSESRPNTPIAIGEIEMDVARRIVSKRGSELHLTPKEFDLLRHLMSHAGFPIPHAKLLAAVWGPEYGGEVEYLRTFVRQLRKKLEDNAGNPKYLLTVSHIGYRFSSSSELMHADVLVG